MKVLSGICNNHDQSQFFIVTELATPQFTFDYAQLEQFRTQNKQTDLPLSIQAVNISRDALDCIQPGEQLNWVMCGCSAQQKLIVCFTTQCTGDTRTAVSGERDEEYVRMAISDLNLMQNSFAYRIVDL